VKLFARDNLCYLGNIVCKGEELPADVPAHLLDHWRSQGAIGEVPVVEEPQPEVPSELSELSEPAESATEPVELSEPAEEKPHPHHKRKSK